MIRDCETLLRTMEDGLRRQADVAVIGLSGGADSLLAAILCARALGRENVYGVSMPCDETDRRTFNALSARQAARLGIRHLERPVAEIADAIEKQISTGAPGAQLTLVNKGNARSRARMCVLYGLAHALAGERQGRRVRVVGTGNLSEGFIGYDTKGGDSVADVFPLADLFKAEVFQLLDFLRDRGVIPDDFILRVPSAGLAPGQTDEGDLGHTYADMERGIRFCLKHAEAMPEPLPDEVTEFVWRRHLANRHKHEAQNAIRLRFLCD